MISATWIYLLVLLQGTPAAGYSVEILYRTETAEQCEGARKLWLAAYAEQPKLAERLRCIKHDQKNVERYPY